MDIAHGWLDHVCIDFDRSDSLSHLEYSADQPEPAPKQFFDAVTHEFKSPIASLKLYLQTLSRRPMEEEKRNEFYVSMMEDVERLDRLITQLLEVAKVQQATETSEPFEWVEIAPLVKTTAEKLALHYDSPRNALVVDVPDVEVFARRVDLEILLRNLMDNALKYSGEPPEVSVTGMVSVDNSILQLIFRDNGKGIPRHLRRVIFKRFYRVGDELERTKPGTGLGLFLVRSIVKRMGGKIRVEDLGKQPGTQFIVELTQIRRPNSGTPKLD